MVSCPKLFFAIHSLRGGGAERVISNLSNYFHERGFEVTIVCLTDARPAYYLNPEIQVISLIQRKEKENIVLRAYYRLLTFFRMYQLLKKEKPDALISFMTSANIWSGLICNILKIPYIVSERTTPDDTVNRFSYLRREFSAFIYGKSKAIVVPAEGIIDGFRKNNSFRKLDNFRVIHNPVNQFKSTTGVVVYSLRFILSVGRLEAQKGFDQLISAFKQADIPEDVHLLISGEGEKRKILETQIKSLGLEHRVKLIGFQENLQDYYQQAELFVLSSFYEGYPNALVEAMSMGCACVATNCEYGPSEIIENEKNGILVPVNQAEALSRAIERVLSDSTLKARISANAGMINYTNSPEHTFAKWEKLILSHL